MNFFKNLSVRNKLFLIAAVPTIVLLIFLAEDLNNKLESKNNLQNVYDAVMLGEVVINTINQMQFERGYSSVYLASGGVVEKNELYNQRIETDKAIQIFNRSAKQYGVDNSIKEYFNKVNEMRDQVNNKSISYDSLVNKYTMYTDSLIKIIEARFTQLNDHEVESMFKTEIYLIKSKDYLSQIRAHIGAALIDGTFSSHQMAEFVDLKSKYESYLYEFRNNIQNKEIDEELSGIQINPSVIKCIEVINQTYDKSVLPKSLTYDRWYLYAISYTNSISVLRGHYQAYVQSISEERLAGINATIYRSFIIAVILLGIIIFLVLAIARIIVDSIKQLRDSANLISSGNLNISLSINSKDEVGMLAESFRKMVEVNTEYAKAAEIIGKGDYSPDVNVRSSQDTLGIALNNMKDDLRKLSIENENRTWLLKGNSELNDCMRGEKRVEELAEEIIKYITPYLGAKIGALFILDKSKLHLISSYAFYHRKENINEISIGQGLVGQAAKEGKPIIFSQIPDDYIRINSGLGSKSPSNIIVYPFKYEGSVKGVIEIGSVLEYTELQLKYLEMVSDNIAIAINAAQSKEQLKSLLEETQQQSEELEAQQEELKQTNEELQEKTKLLENSEAELKVQQEELQQTNQELEEKAELLEKQKNILETAKTEIESKARELEVTSKYKSEFLANMSHELRTPLNSILILAQLMAENRNKTLGEKEIELSKSIYNSGKDLLNLINEILDLSKVEAGKIELDIDIVNIDDVINGLKTTFKEIAKSKSIKFDINYSADSAGKVIYSDTLRIEQILRNLLSNAFKFTPGEGNVSLDIYSPKDKNMFTNVNLLNADDIIAFAVSDTGIGIPENKYQLIFEAFQQADGSTKRKYGGTGLGLSISKELANILGGEIKLESIEGKGSTFTLFLPLIFNNKINVISENKVIMKVPKKEDIEINKDKNELQISDDVKELIDGDNKILILEDDNSFANILLNFVRERGYKGIVSGSGNTALSLARHHKPFAILLDMKLPVMDGAEILRQLKNDPELRHIPVQIISGYDRKKEGIALGAFDYLQKPVDSNDLKNAFERIEDFISKKLKKLLIVEDNKLQNKAITELVGNNDVKSFSVFAGEEAYSLLKKENFDCIIIDLGLPDMSGFELMEKIKKDNKLNKIPVIVYTGKDLNKEETARLNRLASTVILKTAESQERLLDETMLFLHRVESKLPADKQRIIRKLHKSDEILRDKKVLIVDDDIRNIYSLTNVLEDEGMVCITAENGREAISKLNDNQDISIILMDIMMPEMDGYEATKEIRRDNKYSKLPIVALTAKAMKGDKEKCLEAGMSDYASKPVNINQLLSLMRVWLYK